MAQSRLRPWEESIQSEPSPKTEIDPCTARPNHNTSPLSISQEFNSRPSPSHITSQYNSALWVSDPPTIRPELTTSKRRRTEDHVDDHVHQLNGGCCPPECSGLQCVKIREMAGNVTYEIETHERLVHGSAIKDRLKDEQHIVPLVELIREIANRLHHSNTELRKLLESNVTAGLLSKPVPASTLTIQTPPSRRSSGPSKLESSAVSGYQQEQQELHMHRELRSPISSQSYQPLATQHGGFPPVLTSGHAPPSPVSMQTSISQSHPTSLNLAPSASPPIGSTAIPAPATSTPAQAAHLQDLQHQLAVKTLAHSSLHSEYATLLKVLERQRVKCSTLERKFHVSDAEIVALANEKERLEQLVEVMEKQVLELQKSRDEARKQGSDAASQYLRIVQMAGKLHGGATGSATGPEDAANMLDREALLKRVEELESQLNIRRRDTASTGGIESPKSPETGDEGAGKSHVEWLEEELKRLRVRNTRLENGLNAAKQAAVTLAAHGQNVGTVLSKALEEPI